LTFQLLEALSAIVKGTKMTSLTFEVEGMTCAACVGRVERILSTVDGAGSAAVNLARNTATVQGGDATALAEVLKGTGFAARQDRLVLEIEGMTCASCVGRVERGLKALPGVTEAVVNLATETANVRFLVGTLANDTVIKAVSDLGYVAKVQKQTPTPDRKDLEILGLRRQLALATALTLPVFLLEMTGHILPGFHHWIARTIGIQTSWIIQFVLTTLILIGPGRVFYTRGIASFRHAAPDMNALVMVGTAAAYLFSVIATFAPGLLPDSARAVYFEAAAVIVTLILLGRWLEARAKGRTGAAIARLVGLQAKSARVEREGAILELPIEEIIVGDLLHLRPGERIAVDGEVTTGHSYIDESMISGEPVPVEKSAGAEVTGGTVNGTGALTYRATRVGRDTMLAQIIRMVGEAQGAKLPVQDLVNKITAWFVPIVLGIALLTVAAWLLLGPAPALTHALVAGVAVLIIACPCAMGLATPTSIMVGTGRAAELGVLFRKGAALQELQAVGVIALDKTGTLTAGRPELTDFACVAGFNEDPTLRLVAAVEALSEHPIAQAITRAAQGKGLILPATTDFASHTGYGISAVVEGHKVLIGADRLMAREGISLEALNSDGAALAMRGRTPLYAAIDGKAAAVIGVTDPVKPGTAAAIRALHAMGLRVAMITGDNRATAQVIAAELKIDEVVAEVLPEGKVEALQRLRQGGAKVAFVGDGINDAPALAHADIGIAIGSGTDIAIESADVVLMSGDLRAVVSAFRVSTATMRNIRQNLFWAFGYNAALIPVAAGALYPLWGVQWSPMLSAGAMALSSVFVLSNALRLRRVAAFTGDQA
jgi:Cu+-exporting ATPase